MASPLDKRLKNLSALKSTISNTTKTAESIDNQIRNKDIQNELSEMAIQMIPLDDIYSAPQQWNEWNRLPDDKMAELCQSIVTIGQQAPCILWEIDKEHVMSLYSETTDPYKFKGSKYMILSGHNRAYARKVISELESFQEDESYKFVPAVVYKEDLNNQFVEKAKQIIDDTNYMSREASQKEIMRAIIKKTELLKKQQSEGTRSINIAEEIGESLNLTKRTILRYNKLNEKLNKIILGHMFDEKISFKDALEIASYSDEVQAELLNHKDILFNKKRLKKFLSSTRSDMTLNEIEEYLVPEKQSNYVNVTVTVPKGKEDEFFKMVNEWKSSLENM